MPRFENLRKTADRVEKGTLKPTPHPEVEERQSTAKTSSLKDKLGAKNQLRHGADVG